ncbi:uncharacterized protein EDB91DRAFT_391266 [Suillus paluster]|uniref:uncharacterized protein n=1 Tax=Suillus paluster TaxID=48578 RepID=UPI001B8824ED|nr:uncharacterized protein EDB91DRAFT_391266 [Suillus paluster]KAG1739103.1 hypothetical protein EDB91DRAFT_391266 [Suillus paluster]
MIIADVLHRTFVSGLAALSVYGLFMGYAVHRETLAKGRGEMMHIYHHSHPKFLTQSMQSTWH